MEKITFQTQLATEKPHRHLSSAVVDEEAERLAITFKNLRFRAWYCQVIYEFGISKVREWESRTREANEPGKLFSSFVREARKLRHGKT